MRSIPTSPWLAAAALLAGLLGPLPSIAQPVQWAWTAGKQSNDGSINVKSLKSPGSTAVTQKNPSGSAVDLRANATTQPPVLLQTLPPPTAKNQDDLWSIRLR